MSVGIYFVLSSKNATSQSSKRSLVHFAVNLFEFKLKNNIKYINKTHSNAKKTFICFPNTY